MLNKETNIDEDYLYSLPDYVNGKLPDGPLKAGIENKINSDEAFRGEYLSMMNTLKFVKDTSLEEPPGHYFTGLVPRINERLESSSKLAVHPVFHLWRYIVPALTVVLVMIIILRPDRERIENIVSDSEHLNVKTEVVPDTLTSSQETVSAQEEQENPEKTVQTSNQKTVKQNSTKNNEGESFIESIGEIFGESEENTADETEYYNYEGDFHKLSQAEQNELLNNLEKTKF